MGQAGEGFLQQFSVQLDLHLASDMREHEHHLRITQNIHKVRAGTLLTVLPTEYTVQSARLFLQSSELAPLAPSTEGESCPYPLWLRGGTHSLAGEGAVGANSDKGSRHCGTLGIIPLRFTGEGNTVDIKIFESQVYSEKTK